MIMATSRRQNGFVRTYRKLQTQFSGATIRSRGRRPVMQSHSLNQYAASQVIDRNFRLPKFSISRKVRFFDPPSSFELSREVHSALAVAATSFAAPIKLDQFDPGGLTIRDGAPSIRTTFKCAPSR
jgi:hypothetical protein